MTWSLWLDAFSPGGHMAESDALAHLRDIHLPPPISWWPLAPGWYVICFMLLVVIVSIFYLVKRRYLQRYPKRQALRLLAFYEQEWQNTQQGSRACANVSELLRRVALAYFPRHDVAGLHGEAWLNFLNQSSSSLNFTALRDYLLVFPYQQDEQTANLEPLFTSAREWIKQRGQPCLN